MSDNVENLLLEHLKRIQAELSAARERDKEVVSRLGRIEILLARVSSAQAQNEEAYAEQSVRMDRLAERVERLERRLELA